MATNISQIEEDETSEEQKQWMLENDYPLDKYKIDENGKVTRRGFEQEENQEEKYSPAGTFATEFVRDLPGTLVGIGTGMATGTGLGALGLGPWGAGAGALVGGIAGGMAANEGTRVLMEKYTPELLKRLNVSASQNPKAATAAGIAQAVVGGRPSMEGIRTIGKLAVNRTLPVAARTAAEKALVHPTINLASNVAGGVSGEALNVAQGGEVDPYRLAGNIAGGIAFSGRPWYTSATTPAPAATRLPNGDMLIDAQNRSKSAEFVAKQNEGKAAADLSTDIWEGKSSADIANLIAEKIKIGQQKLSAQDVRTAAADPNIVNNLNDPIKLEEAIGLMEGGFSSAFQKSRAAVRTEAEKVAEEAAKTQTDAEKAARKAFNTEANKNGFIPNDARYEASKITPVDDIIISSYMREDATAKVTEDARKAEIKKRQDALKQTEKDDLDGLTPQQRVDRDTAAGIKAGNKAESDEQGKQGKATEANKEIRANELNLDEARKKADAGMQKRANEAKAGKQEAAEDAAQAARDLSDKQQTNARKASLKESRAHARENGYSYNLERADYFFENNGIVDEATRTRYANEDAAAIRDAKARKAKNAEVNEKAEFEAMSPAEQIAFTAKKEAVRIAEEVRLANRSAEQTTREGIKNHNADKAAIKQQADLKGYDLTRARLSELLNAPDPLKAAADNAVQYKAEDDAAEKAITDKIAERDETAAGRLAAAEERRVAAEARKVARAAPKTAPAAKAAEAAPVDTTVIDKVDFPRPDEITHTFKTTRGSEYAYYGNNEFSKTSIRNRSGAEHKDTTKGLQKESRLTIFVDEENLGKAGIVQIPKIATRFSLLDTDLKAAFILTEDSGVLKAGSGWPFSYTTEPKVGLFPVEIYYEDSPVGDSGRNVHFGTIITEVNSTTAKAPEAATVVTAPEVVAPAATAAPKVKAKTTAKTPASANARRAKSKPAFTSEPEGAATTTDAPVPKAKNPPKAPDAPGAAKRPAPAPKAPPTPAPKAETAYVPDSDAVEKISVFIDAVNEAANNDNPIAKSLQAAFKKGYITENQRAEIEQIKKAQSDEDAYQRLDELLRKHKDAVIKAENKTKPKVEADPLTIRTDYVNAQGTLRVAIETIRDKIQNYRNQQAKQEGPIDSDKISSFEMGKLADETRLSINNMLRLTNDLIVGGRSLYDTDALRELSEFTLGRGDRLLNKLNKIDAGITDKLKTLSTQSTESTGANVAFSRDVQGPAMSQKNLEDLIALAARHNIKVVFGTVKDPVTGNNVQGSATLDTRTIVIDPNLARATTGLHEVAHIIYNEAARESMQRSLGETAQSTAAYKAEFDARIAEGLTPVEAHKLAMEEGVIRAFADQHPNVEPKEIAQWFYAVKASLKNMVSARLSQSESAAWMWIATHQLTPWNNAEGFVPLTNSRVRYNRQEEEFKEAPNKVPRNFNPMKSVLDRVIEMFPKLGNSLKTATNERDFKIGQWGSKAESEIVKLSPAKQKILINHHYDDLDAKTATAPSDTTLIPALTEIRAALLKVAQDGNAEGHMIQTVQGNRPRSETEHYFPAQEVDAEVIAAFADPSRGADQRALRDSFLDWTQKQWKDNNKIAAKETAAEYNQRAIDAANEKYTERLSQMQTGGDNQADPTFAGSRKPEGFTLPRSWRSNDLASVFSNYIKRSSIDYATQKHLEVDENVASMIGLPTWNKGEEVTPRLETDHRKNKDVNLALNQFAGVSSNPLGSGVIARTAGLVGSLAIGPVSGLGDLTTTTMTGMKYLQPSDYFSGLTSFLSKVSKTAELAARSQASGLNDPNSARQLKAQLDLADKTAGWVIKTTDFITKWTGKNKLEYASRVMAQGWGEVITEHAVANANRGDAESIKFMENVDPNWKNADPQSLAASAGRLMQGSYDARQLPAWMINSAAAPYFTWSKWSIGQLNTFTNTAVKPLLNGNPVPLISQLVIGALGGSVVKAVTEWAKNKDGIDPTWAEIGYAIKKKPEKEISLTAQKLFTLMSTAGTFGFAGDLAKMGIDTASGNKLRIPAKMPLADFAQTSIQRASAMAEAMYKGEDFFDVIIKGVKDEAKEHVQLVQVANNWLSEKSNTEYEDRRRNKIFNQMNDLPTGSTTFSESYENLKEAQLDDMDRNDPALKPLIAQLVREAKLRNPNNREGLKAAIRKLTTVRNSIMPNPEARESRAKAAEFVKFAEAQLAGGGKEIKQRWIRQKQLNEYKKRLIKSKT